MVTSDFGKAIAHGYLFLTNVLNTAKIDKVVVPDIVQAGSTGVVLDCQFAAPGEHFTLQWWYTSGRADHNNLVYEWTPPLPPKTAGVLEGRLDFSYKVSALPTEEYRGIRLLRVDPQLSGEYTCVVIVNNSIQAQESKRMLVYSPEEELEIAVKQKNNNYPTIQITCFARGMYPQPDLILEYDKEPIVQQIQRVWHVNNMLQYDAETIGQISANECRHHLVVTCRLHLPQADYTAIKKKIFSMDEECNKGRQIVPLKTFTMLFVYLLPFTY